MRSRASSGARAEAALAAHAGDHTVKLVRAILLALLASLLVGLAIGTAIRLRLEQPVRYIGALAPRSAPAALPDDVFDARSPILDARHHEEQIG